jgi:hypothetical protein
MRLDELYRYMGQTVTIFTTSGGATGCGFTGLLLCVNPAYITLVDRIGPPPADPLNGTFSGTRRASKPNGECFYNIGSVCDIPTDKIVSFCHNAI